RYPGNLQINGTPGPSHNSPVGSIGHLAGQLTTKPLAPLRVNQQSRWRSFDTQALSTSNLPITLPVKTQTRTPKSRPAMRRGRTDVCQFLPRAFAAASMCKNGFMTIRSPRWLGPAASPAPSCNSDVVKMTEDDRRRTCP